MDYHQDNPTVFFTIINNTKLLKVPEGFLKHLKEDLSSNSMLISRSGDEWQVTIMKKGKNVYMQNGWSQFLKDNSVVLDEFLLFTYHGGNCFHVQIFGGNGLERLCLKEAKEEKTATPQIFGQEQAAAPSLSRSSKSKQRKTCSCSLHLHEAKSCQEDLPFSNKASLSKDFPKPQSSEECKLPDSFTSRNPHWKHLMTKCSVERCMLPIAAWFARKYIPEALKQIYLWNSEGKFWEVSVDYFRNRNTWYAGFRTGWKRFVRDNNFMKGDTCIFEVEEEGHWIVHIFRTGCAQH